MDVRMYGAGKGMNGNEDGEAHMHDNDCSSQRNLHT